MSTTNPSNELLPTAWEQAGDNLLPYAGYTSLASAAAELMTTTDAGVGQFEAWLQEIDPKSLPQSSRYIREANGSTSLALVIDPAERALPGDLEALNRRLNPDNDGDALAVSIISTPDSAIVTLAPAEVARAIEGLAPELSAAERRAALDELRRSGQLSPNKTGLELTLRGADVRHRGGLWDKQPNFATFGTYNTDLALRQLFGDAYMGANMLFQDSLRNALMGAIWQVVENPNLPQASEPSGLERVLAASEVLDGKLAAARQELRRQFPEGASFQLDPMDERTSPVLRAVLTDWGIRLDEPVNLQMIEQSGSLHYAIEPYSLTPDNASFWLRKLGSAGMAGFVPITRDHGLTGYMRSPEQLLIEARRPLSRFVPPSIYTQRSPSDQAGRLEAEVELAIMQTLLGHTDEIRQEARLERSRQFLAVTLEALVADSTPGDQKRYAESPAFRQDLEFEAAQIVDKILDLEELLKQLPPDESALLVSRREAGDGRIETRMIVAQGGHSLRLNGWRVEFSQAYSTYFFDGGTYKPGMHGGELPLVDFANIALPDPDSEQGAYKATRTSVVAVGDRGIYQYAYEFARGLNDDSLFAPGLSGTVPELYRLADRMRDESLKNIINRSVVVARYGGLSYAVGSQISILDSWL